MHHMLLLMCLSFTCMHHVQGACAILSEEWNDVADCLARIADISQMVGGPCLWS
jgi:hypothetical protein